MVRSADATSTSARGLAKRLRAETPTAADLAELEVVKAVRQLLDGRATHQQIADSLSWPRYRVTRFINNSRFRVYSQWLAEQQIKAGAEVESRAAHRQLTDDRARFAKLTDPALTYMEECFARDRDGVLKDDGKAMWATALVVKGRGLDTPEHGGRPLIQINIGTIQHGQAQIAADDRAAAVTVEGEVLPPTGTAEGDTPSVLALPRPTDGGE
jgi:hypothetical protein